MALDPAEWLVLLSLFVVIVLIIKAVISRREKVIESVILSLIRSKNGATIDDIILTAHLSSEKANKEINKLLSRGVIKAIEREGKTYYVTA